MDVWHDASVSRQRTTLTVRRSVRRPARTERLAWAVLAMFACVMAHEATYLIHFITGSDHTSTIAGAGQDGLWLVFVLATAMVTAGLLVAAMLQLRRLRREAASAPTLSDGDGLRGYLSLAIRCWCRLALYAGLLYLAQENAEALRAGSPVPGLDVVLRHGELPLLMLLLSMLVVALVAALVHWRRLVLLGRIAALAHAWDRSAARGPQRAVSEIPSRSHIPGSLGGRAPPRIGFASFATFKVDPGR